MDAFDGHFFNLLVAAKICSCGYSSQRHWPNRVWPVSFLRGFQLALYPPESPPFTTSILLMGVYSCKRKRKKSSTFLVRSRSTIFIQSKFVIYFSNLCPKVEVSLSKNLQTAAQIASLAACLLDRILLPKIFNDLAWKLKASGRRTFAIR